MATPSSNPDRDRLRRQSTAAGAPLGGSARSWRMYGLATEWIFAGLGMGAMGYLIDLYAGTWPVWTLVLASLGVVGGLSRLIRVGLKEFAAETKRDRTPKP